MDAQWVDQACNRFIFAAATPLTDEAAADAETHHESMESFRTVMELWPVMRAVASELTPPRYLPPWSEVSDGSYSQYLALCVEIHNEVAAQADIERYVRPQAPRFTIDSLHPWVWDNAGPLWEVNRQDAINAAARAVNAHIQQKAGRKNVSEVDLTNNVWSDKPLKPEQEDPRLWFPGEHDDSWKSRMAGARALGQACFQGVRNITSHEHGLDLSEVQAVEYLAMFSTLSRWAEECEVVGVKPPVEPVTVRMDGQSRFLEIARTMATRALEQGLP